MSSGHSQAGKKVMYFPMRSAMMESIRGSELLREHYGIRSEEMMNCQCKLDSSECDEKRNDENIEHDALRVI